MKKLLLLLCFGIVPFVAGLPPSEILTIEIKPPIRPYEALWQATAFIESLNNPNAYNPIEMATGIVQIRPIKLKDYNKRTGKSYSLKQMYDISISKEVFMYYCMKNHSRGIEFTSKQWNGSGEKTVAYWTRIKSKIK